MLLLRRSSGRAGGGFHWCRRGPLRFPEGLVSNFRQQPCRFLAGFARFDSPASPSSLDGAPIATYGRWVVLADLRPPRIGKTGRSIRPANRGKTKVAEDFQTGVGDQRPGLAPR